MSYSLETLKKLPKMVVFDLDYTLWPFWVDTHVDPPFHKNSSGKVEDMRGKLIKYYPESPKVLEFLSSHKIGISVASRTGEVDGAEQLIKLFGWNNYFQNKQIYPGSKDKHFKRISEATKVGLEDMVFFDDEQRNIVDLEKLGVVCILVKNGMTVKVLMEGLKKFDTLRT
ncbi:magnesium-dependent phosphatase 1-like [Adelges cooleyi]|uniref:magnesium-dependent phosphatase 1-like n=1 Tax=Adelges cooleyi TaxID=133065 RepID=UPI00217F6233|nr:magnesium-dependent phosphatase 1-like [Adelges cooleyi]XP_050431804.1 magnesium-dependent phosphatase 1-like [Adelges cooleyi]XP_050431805.1 magnesium-dependent phosphatase 1-like [Adelges cooleyi]XP_050431806.1 magnesium-dependent phosphatase 1-like [Adelges cooleyi]XP_050431807.1 magnesium-dependent phosphatase 1-like [Adelges cooleyi]